jgi:adenylate cyclase
MQLRSLLVLLFSGLLILTAGSIGWLGYARSHQAAKHFTTQEIALANGSAAHHVADFLDEPADRLLSEMTLRARRGMLNLKDDRALGFDLAERLRVNPTLAWISYSDAATGHFVGVWRNDKGEVVLNSSTPGHGEAIEEIVYGDGTTAPYTHSKPKDFDPRLRDWFVQAAKTDSMVWSPPYTFIDGVDGITASRAWRPFGSDIPAGVFTVDFYLKDLQGLLDGVAGNLPGFCAILEPDGQVLCASEDKQAGALTAALSAWVKANPGFKNVNGQKNDDGQINSHLIPIKVEGVSYLAALARIDAPSGLQCIVAATVPKSVVYENILHATGRVGAVALAALGLALLVGGILSHRVSAPLRALGDDMARVGRFQLAQGRKEWSVVLEVNQLHDAADRMKSGLRSFIKYVPGDLVRQLLSTGKEAVLGGDIRRLTLFFSDIEGFTSHSEKVAPDVLIHELADYFEIVSRCLRENSGTIDKFIGDGLLAFFNAPQIVENHENLACRATLAALRDLAASPLTSFRTRIGLHCGEVLVGNIGTQERFAYTVLGDPVNVASRLENLNKVYGTQVMASREVRDSAGDDFEWRHLDRVSVAGRKAGFDIYELMGLKNGVDEVRCHQRNFYEEALAHYFGCDFKAAQAMFAKLAGENQSDKASALMAARCELFLAQGLPENWNGVFSYEFK